jgi:lambda repressor-like predicted transcriptional regulator
MTTAVVENNKLEFSALQGFAPIALALRECSPKMQAAAMELFADLASNELDAYERNSTLTLLAEILFPNAAPTDQLPGLDAARAEELAPQENPEAAEVLSEMNHQEKTFAERLKTLMVAQGITQSQLAEKVGIGQPAISMFLNRQCRPQQKTVQKFASALGVDPQELWPT